MPRRLVSTARIRAESAVSAAVAGAPDGVAGDGSSLGDVEGLAVVVGVEPPGVEPVTNRSARSRQRAVASRPRSVVDSTASEAVRASTGTSSHSNARIQRRPTFAPLLRLGCMDRFQPDESRKAKVRQTRAQTRAAPAAPFSVAGSARHDAHEPM